MRPRLLHLARVDPLAPRPQAVQAVATAAALARSGAEVTLVLDRPRVPCTPVAALAWHGEPEVPGLRLWWPPSGYPPLASWARRSWLGGALREVDAVLVREVGDALRVEALRAAAGPGGRPRLVLEWHAIPSRHGQGDPGEARAVRAADAHVAVSGGLARALSDAFPGAVFEVVPNGARLDEAAARARVAALRDARVVVHAGLMRRAEDAAPLAALARGLPEGLELRVAGDADHPACRPLARASEGGTARVRFAGFLPPADVGRLYDGALCALAPYAETLNTREFASPLKVLDAHARGVPLVATDLPAVRELAQAGRDALLVPPGDASGWPEAVARLHADRGLAARLAEAGLERARGRTWDARAARLLAVLAPPGGAAR